MGTCPDSASTAAGGLGLIPSGETKIPHSKLRSVQQSQMKQITVKSLETESRPVSAGLQGRGNRLMGNFRLGR